MGTFFRLTQVFLQLQGRSDNQRFSMSSRKQDKRIIARKKLNKDLYCGSVRLEISPEIGVINFCDSTFQGKQKFDQ